jgi:hypothetical protein
LNRALRFGREAAQEYFEERYRERVLMNLERRA